MRPLLVRLCMCLCELNHCTRCHHRPKSRSRTSTVHPVACPTLCKFRRSSNASLESESALISISYIDSCFECRCQLQPAVSNTMALQCTHGEFLEAGRTLFFCKITDSPSGCMCLDLQKQLNELVAFLTRSSWFCKGQGKTKQSRSSEHQRRMS